MSYEDLSAEQKERELYKFEAGTSRAYGVETLEQEAARLGLPALVGSPKQVAWALRIRREQLGHVDAWVGLQMHKSYQAGKPLKFTTSVNRLKDITSAHWWIEHREYDAQTLLLAAKRDQEAGRL